MHMKTNLCTGIKKRSLVWLTDEPRTTEQSATAVCVFFMFLCVQFAQTVQAVQQETSCSLGGWELLSKMEFRLSDAGRLLEAGVGSKAEDVTDGQAGGGDGRLSSPPCAIYIFHRICAHTPCCHNIDTFLLLVKIEEEEV